MSDASQSQYPSGFEHIFQSLDPSTQNPELLSEDILLIKWIEQNPEYTDLVKSAKGETSPANWNLPKLPPDLTNIFIANPDEFYGKAFVSKELKEHAEVTARVVSASSLLDFATNAPLLYFAFKDFGFILALLVSSTTNVIVLKFTNDTATAVSGRKPVNKFWSGVAAVGLIAMNAVQSLVSGVGVELLNNQSVLSSQKAQEVIQEQIQKTETIKNLDSPKYRDANARCEEGKQKLNSFNRNHPRWDSLYAELNGQWGERYQDWRKFPLEKLPICHQVLRLREETFRNYELAKADLEVKLAVRVRIGNDIVFLQKEIPAVYAEHFTTNGEIKSGVEAVRLATQNFFGKLKGGDLEGLGFSLFFFCLSVITSSVACFMTIAHAQREDTQKSRNEAVEQERDRWLEEMRRMILHRHQRQEDN